MKENPRVLGVAGSAVGLSAFALALGACCVAPWAVALLGVAGAVFLARLAFLQPYAVATTLALASLGLWLVYRRPRGGACDPATRSRQRRIVWTAVLIIIALDVASFAPRFLS